MVDEEKLAQLTELIIGGEQYKGHEDYLRTINGIFNKLANLSFSNAGNNTLLWDMDYSTKMLINSVLDPEARDEFSRAKEVIYQIECLKRVDDPTKFSSFRELKNSMKADDLVEAGIDTCMCIIGECRTYFDRYWGLETKLAVMQ